MKLEEIIKTVKHDVDYFQTCGEPFQRGRLWEAQKILDMLYKLEPAQLQQHGVVRPASASGSEGEPLPAEGSGEANTRADWKVKCHKCGCAFKKVTDLWDHLDRPCV